MTDTAYKYPYIPKDLYPAVMFAANCVRKYGTFNVACRAAARKFRVSEADVRKHLSARSHAGQTGRKHRPFKWFTACAYSIHGDDGYISFSMPTVVKATSKSNAMKQFRHFDEGEGHHFHGGGGHIMREYQSEDEARANLRADYTETKKNDYFDKTVKDEEF